MSMILLATTLLSAAQGGAVPVDAQGEAIVVEGRRAAAVRSYVDKTARAVDNYQIARWRQSICVHVDGLDPPHSAFVENRINAVAARLAIGVAGGACRPNLSVTVTDAADALTDALIKRRPRMFGPVSFASEAKRPLQPSEIAALRAPRPVRWFVSSTTRGPDGQRVDGSNMLYFSSRIRPTTREDIETTIVIVDGTKIERVDWGQFADYLAMVTLANPDMTADYAGANSILTLFGSPDTAPAGLTDQDWALLRALQHIDTLADPKRAQAMIRDHILHDAGGPAPPAP